MTKNEIIESIAAVNVPPGASLVEHGVPGTGLVFSHHTAENADGLRIVLAQRFADSLKAELQSLPETPDAELFNKVHSAVLKSNQAIIDQTFIDAVEDELIKEHKKMIERLREIARKLGINYTEPEDPLLQDNPDEAA